MAGNHAIERQAKLHAREHKRGEPAIRKVYWFPDDYEVRLVAVEDDIEPELGGEVAPFYFGSSPEDDMPAPEAVALIRADEVGRLKLPENWGTWDDAIELEVDAIEMEVEE